jgi:DNA-binding CsgD family transcriptional regulator/tetratricopeptide (TPR) repeat protein
MSVGPALAGRSRELSAVTAAITGASGTAVIVIAGEPGIGKSRLLSAATDSCSDAGVVVFTGWCLKQSQNLPLSPIADIIHGLAGHNDGATIKAALVECPSFVQQELTRLVPELAQPGDAPTAAVTAGGGDFRLRLFDAIRWLLSALPGIVPCAVAIEDLHWADAATLEFVDYLFTAGHVPELPVVVTCRGDDLASEPIAEWVEKVRRGGHLTHLDLPALTLAETADQIESLHGSRPSAATVERVFARSEGNPFFTEQLASWTQFEHAGLPAGLTALLLSRTTRVQGIASSVLTALAVAARPLAESDLAASCLCRVDEVRVGLRELLDERLIQRPDERGAYRVRHALLAEAITTDLLPGDRSDVHGRIAQAMAAWSDDQVANEIADHYSAAGRTAPELPWRIRAAGRADAVFAPREAATQWLRAINAWDQRPPTALVAGLSVVDIHLRAVQSLAKAGAYSEAFELAVQARARFGTQASTGDQVRLHAAVGYRSTPESEIGFDALASAIEIGQALPPSREYVSALHFYGGRLGDRGRYEERSELWRRAATTARQLGYAAEQKAVMADLVFDPLLADDLPATELQISQTLAIQLDTNDPISELYPLVQITDLFLKIGRLHDTIRIGVPVIGHAQDTGLTNTLLMNILRGNVHEAMIELGQVNRSAEILDAVPSDRPQRANLILCMAKAESALLSGRPDEAATLWLDNRDLLESGLHHDLWYNLALRRLEFDIWRGDPACSLPYAVGVLELNATTNQNGLSSGLFALAMRACAELGEAARAASDATLLATATAQAQHLANLVATTCGDPFAELRVMPTHSAFGKSWQAELGRLRGESDPDAWAEAATAWTGLERPFRTAYARLRQAETILAHRGSRADASQLLRAAAAQSGEHVPLHKAIHALARIARLDIASGGPEPAAVRQAPTSPLGLTVRERDVLRLVAEGKTNVEIGQALFISAKTVSVHVTNILRKLDVGSRVAAATRAQRSGLLDD